MARVSLIILLALAALSTPAALLGVMALSAAAGAGLATIIKLFVIAAASVAALLPLPALLLACATAVCWAARAVLYRTARYLLGCCKLSVQVRMRSLA